MVSLFVREFSEGRAFHPVARHRLHSPLPGRVAFATVFTVFWWLIVPPRFVILLPTRTNIVPCENAKVSHRELP
jgi:hypothetical protein